MNDDNACTPYRDLLPAYATGHLAAAQRALVARHLADCQRCQDEIAQWRAIGQTVEEARREIPAAPAQTDLWSKLAASLHTESRANTSQPHLNGARSAGGERHAMQPNSEELIFDAAPPYAATTQARQPDPLHRSRRWSALSIAAALLIVVLGVVLFTMITPRKPGTGTAPAATASVTAGPGTVAPTAGTAAATSGTGTAAPTIATGGAPLPLPNNLFGIAIVGDGNVWVGGDMGLLAHYSNGRWQRFSLATDFTIYSIAMTSASDGWAVGSQNNGTQPLLLHDSNGTWKAVTVPLVGESLRQVQMLSATDGWAWSNNAVLHYSDGQWSDANVPFGFGSQQIEALTLTATTDGWAAVNDSSTQTTTMWHYQNGAWSRNITVNKFVSDISMISTTEGWAQGSNAPPTTGKRLSSTGPIDSYILHYDGTQWTQDNPAPAIVSLQNYGIDTLFIHNSQEGWATLVANAVDHHLATLHVVNNQWTVIPEPANLWLHDITLVAPGDSWAVGITPNGNRTIVIAHYQNGQWMIVNP